VHFENFRKEEKPVKSRILFVSLAVVLALSVGLIGCTEETPPTEEPELTVYTLWTPEAEKAGFDAVLAEFEQQTGIATRHIPISTEDMLITLPVSFLAEKTPADVVLAPWPSWIRDLNEHLLSVDGLLDEAEFAAVHLGPVSVADNIYGVPFKLAGKPGFWYKPSFFDAHNLEPPETYAEFVDLVAELDAIPTLDAAIASGDGVGWPLSDQVEGFIIGLGGYQLQLDLIDGSVDWTDDEVKVDVFGPLVELLEAGYFSVPAEWGAQVEQFDDELYGIFWMGDWIVGMVDDPEDIAFFPFPETDGVVGAIDYAIIPAYTELPDESQELVRFLATPEAQEIWADMGGYLAPNTEVPLGIYPPVSQTVVEFLLEVTVVPDLDDTVGGSFQLAFWDQLKLLWVNPGELDNVLEALQEEAP
jgi:multiple sugar transport system substrate-binding protein